MKKIPLAFLMAISFAVQAQADCEVVITQADGKPTNTVRYMIPGYGYAYTTDAIVSNVKVHNAGLGKTATGIVAIRMANGSLKSLGICTVR